MYFASKALEAIGLTIIAGGFLLSFPKLMNGQALTVGLVMFVSGWLIERFLLKR